MKIQLLGISIMLLGIAVGVISNGVYPYDAICMVVTGIGFLISLIGFFTELARDIVKKNS